VQARGGNSKRRISGLPRVPLPGSRLLVPQSARGAGCSTGVGLRSTRPPSTHTSYTRSASIPQGPSTGAAAEDLAFLDEAEVQLKVGVGAAVTEGMKVAIQKHDGDLFAIDEIAADLAFPEVLERGDGYVVRHRFQSTARGVMTDALRPGCLCSEARRGVMNTSRLNGSHGSPVKDRALVSAVEYESRHRGCDDRLTSSLSILSPAIRRRRFNPKYQSGLKARSDERERFSS
jgi:hypothetical protein